MNKLPLLQSTSAVPVIVTDLPYTEPFIAIGASPSAQMSVIVSPLFAAAKASASVAY